MGIGRKFLHASRLGLVALVGAAVVFSAATLALAGLEVSSVERVSVDTGGGDSNAASEIAWVGDSGNKVVFWSYATDLVATDTNGMRDVFMRDLTTDQTTLVSVSSAGVQANSESFPWDVSSDGRYVVLNSSADNLIPVDTNTSQDVFLRDVVSLETTLVSQATDGSEANFSSSAGSVSDDGRYVAFTSMATNLVAGDVAFTNDVFVRDLTLGTTTCISENSTGTIGINDCSSPTISADGRYVAFLGYASGPGTGDGDLVGDGMGAGVYLRDLLTDTTTRVSVTVDALPENGISYYPFISADGNVVAWHSTSSNLVEGDMGGQKDVFAHNIDTGDTVLVSKSTDGVQGNGESRWAALTTNGRYIAFYSYSDNLAADDVNAFADVFLHDLLTGRTELVSRNMIGGGTDGDSETPAISADGSYVAFESGASNLVSGDTNGVYDVFRARIAWKTEYVPLAGTDRFKTSVAVSQQAFPIPADVNTVVIATGYNWPDALGGAAYAGAVNGPILLVETNAIPSAVMSEITRLAPTDITILGGEGAVGETVFDALEGVVGAGNVQRIWGADRFATSRAIAAETVSLLPSYDGIAFVATGLSFPDALAASPLAVANGWPTYLVQSTLDKTTSDAMAADGVSDVLVLGGTAAVPTAVETALDARFMDVDRLKGADRYGTAYAVATFGVQSGGLGWDHLALSTGHLFPDALSGGVLQGRSGSVMLLTDPAALSSATRTALTAHRGDIVEVRYLGGTGAITQPVRNSVTGILR